MYGGTIAGALTIIVWSKCKKIPFAATLDMGGSRVILGQVIGRWANFVNREAFGYQTDIFCRMGLTRPGHETVYVHPTFLYESLWNLAGFLIINFYWYKRTTRKYDGQLFLFYVFWYGTGRAMVEGLRTDSLYIPGTGIRTSQLVAACSAVVALALLLVNLKRRTSRATSTSRPPRPPRRQPSRWRRRPNPRRQRPNPAEAKTEPAETEAGAAAGRTGPKRKKKAADTLIIIRRNNEMSDYNDLLNSLKAAAGSAANMARDFAESAGRRRAASPGTPGRRPGSSPASPSSTARPTPSAPSATRPTRR